MTETLNVEEVLAEVGLRLARGDLSARSSGPVGSAEDLTEWGIVCELRKHVQRFQAELAHEREHAKAFWAANSDGALKLAAAEAQVEALRRPITMQDVRLAAGEGKLSATDVLAGCNAELRRRAALSAPAEESEEVADFVDEDLQCLEGLEEESGTNPWRDIASAPKDRRQPILLIARYPTGRDWTDIYHCWWDDICWARWPHRDFGPTHWMPVVLPGAPARSEKVGDGLDWESIAEARAEQLKDLGVRYTLYSMAIRNAVDILANRGRFGIPDDALALLKGALSTEAAPAEARSEQPAELPLRALLGEDYCDQCQGPCLRRPRHGEGW